VENLKADTACLAGFGDGTGEAHVNMLQARARVTTWFPSLCCCFSVSELRANHAGRTGELRSW